MRSGRERKWRAVAAALLPLAITSFPAYPADWRITPRLTIQETYTDNVALAPEGEEEDEFITQINPGFSIQRTGEGGRVEVDVRYDLQNIAYRSGQDADRDPRHRLQAIADAEVIRQMVFLKARATASQQNVNNRGRLATSSVSDTGNVEDVYTFSLTPIFRHHLGRYADTEVSTTYDWVENGADSNTSNSGGIRASVVSGRYFARLPWSLSYSRRTLEQDGDRDDTTFENMSLRLNYVFNRKYSTFVTLGRSENDTSNRDIEDERVFWQVGLNWNPSRRTSFSGGYEDRAIGESVFFNFNHRQRRTVWSARLAQSLTTARDLQLERVLVPLVDPFGEPIETPLGEAIFIPVDTVRQDTRVIVNQSFDGRVALRGRRSTYTAGLQWSERDAEGEDDETLTGISLGLSRRLSETLNANLRGRWQQTEFDIDDETDRLWSVDFSLGYRVAQNATGRLQLSHVENDSGDGVGDYKENRVTAGLTLSF